MSRLGNVRIYYLNRWNSCILAVNNPAASYEGIKRDAQQSCGVLTQKHNKIQSAALAAGDEEVRGVEEHRTLLVGIDLGDRVTQMHCFDFTTYEPVPIGRMAGGERIYEIPTAMAVEPVRGEWYWNDEMAAGREGMIRFHHLLRDVVQGESITIGSYQVESFQVLKRYLVKVLSLLKEYYPNDKIRKLVVSVADKNERLVKYIKAVGEEIGIPAGGVVVQNHRQSYMYYAISQPKELWNNNVGLFEWDGEECFYSQIDIDRKTEPYIIGVSTKSLFKEADWQEIKEQGNKQLAYAFVNMAGTVLHKQLVTTVYVTGREFEMPWANEALKELCAGRRVFRGQNLFTRGACYAARELSGQGKLDYCLFLDEDMIASNVSIRVYRDASIQEVVLARAGILWSEVDSSIDVIPDNEEEMQLTIQDVLKHETRAHMLSLSGFSGRDNKMTRFTIRLRFADAGTCIVTLKDNGFGEFCPSSNRVWERHISIH